MDSLLDDSVFDVDAAESSDFAAEPVQTKAKPAAKAAPKPRKPAAPKAAPKKKATTAAAPKAKSTAKKRPKPDTEDEDEDDDVVSLGGDGSQLSATPPQKQKKAPAKKLKSSGQPLATIENEAMALDASISKPPSASKAKGGSTDRYQKLTQLEHIIKRPDTYIGSVEHIESKLWVFNSEKETMEMREVHFVPGLYKIFDEILVNAADNKHNDKNMDTIKVTIDKAKGQISIFNNGRGIPIEIHQKEKIWIPEMIFGHLLTSSNYDDEQQKVTGGRNGYGAKLCNIFSTKFSLETAHSKTKKLYKQTWTGNMSKMGEAVITDQKGDDYTKVTFIPDFKRFKMDGIDDDFEALVKRRVYDLAGTIKGVKVYLDGQRVKVKNFKEYMEMYTKAIKVERGEEAAGDQAEIITDTDKDRWEVGFAVSDGAFQQVSFVNSIATTSGGTHVNYVADQICDYLLDEMKKKKNKGGATLKPSQIKNHLFVFVNSQIVNPAFTSQTKEQLTTKVSQFGSKFAVSAQFLKKICDKTQVLENIKSFAAQKADQILKKSDGSRRSRMDNPKLTDANKAGTKDGWQCTLILTEGDSAKGLAMTGRSVVGPDLFGVFPLRGKLLNVRDATVDQVSKNAEIQNIKNILGLKHKQVYTDCKALRYGHIMIMTDQDHDGSHIKGLLINFLQVQYPSLLKMPEFLVEFITPIVRVYKGDPKKPSKQVSFFTMPEYETWKEVHKDERGWEHKYYKGLGTSLDEDAEKYFRDLDRHLKEFHAMQQDEPELLELAFSKKKADERKEWLRQFRPGTYLDHSSRKITYTDFVNRELILFSMADNLRSIPSIIDGFKPGQRKVLFSCLKRNLKKDMKVVELAGYIMGVAAYHHGEASLQQTIVGLAQTFVGSNNLNTLEPSGNFGSRLQGGSDSASARYIFTRLSPFARRVFHPLDEPLLKHNTDDDKLVEPETYVPVVPMILINGADGIGTGWSTSIPNYNPADIVDNLRAMMRGEEPKTMLPWFRDFDGTIEQIGPDRFKCTGTIKQTGDNEVEITELPVRLWTQDYKDKIVDILKGEKAPSWIKDYDDYNTKQKVHFVLRLEDKYMKAAVEEGLLERFKLVKTIATSNLVAFDAQGRITKYNNVEEILKAFYDVRIQFYEKRKAWQLSEMEHQLAKLTNQARFVREIIEGKLVVSKKRKRDLVAELKQKGYKPFPKVVDATKDGELEPAMEDEDEDREVDAAANAYDYLLGMAIWSLTKERYEKLNNQIGDKQAEIDDLIKKSKEDLWNTDLDDFMEQWNYELEDEKKRRKDVSRLARRVSSKLRTQTGPSRKRKTDDDDEFDARPKKAKGAKKAEPKGLLTSYLTKDTSKPKPVVDKPKPAPAALKAAAPAPKEPLGGFDGASDSDAFLEIGKAAAKQEQDSEDEVVRPAASRGARAARKPVAYTAPSSDSEMSDGGFDVSKMVKGIGESAAATAGTSRPLFAATATLSRPGSSAGIVARKSFGRDRAAIEDGDSADETDYARLAPSSARGPAPATVISDDEGAKEDGMDVDPPSRKSSAPKATANGVTKRGRPPAATSKPKPDASRKAGAAKTNGAKAPAAKDKPPAKAKPAKPAAEKKQMTLSPAAKAYAAKQAKASLAAPKGKKRLDSDDEASDVERMANDMLSDDDDDDDVALGAGARGKGPTAAPSGGRPARRAAAQPKKWVVDDDDEDEDVAEEDSADFDDDESE